MRLVYKILSRAEWSAAEAAGVFFGSAVDLADGFIHFSTAFQTAETARRHFAGQTDLVTLEIDADSLGDALKWETSRGGDLFPHLYAPLKTDLVRVVRDAPTGADGVPVVGDLG